MSICGLVIHASPGNGDNVVSALVALDGVEVHEATEDGRLVVTVDNPNDGEAAKVLDSFREIDGVLSTSLVYTHFEEDSGEGEHAS
ncbi:chaperone NapD [Pseudomonadota bacterium]